MTHIEKMDLRSMDIAKDKIEHLKRVFPEVFTEKKVDFERLRQILGDEIETGRERYGLSWAGKSEVLKIIQKPGIGALKPCREESVNFDDTENLFIEGDNLEVLKLLQKSYYGKIKMIYIDPPYNTGNDFIYPDNYSESLQTYLEYTGQADSNGRKFTTNPETDGRFHTKWLNMMYPRLYLARNLLQNDGVIFVSIDDNEVYNLRVMMNEIFGEENFLSQFIRQTVKGGTGPSSKIRQTHDYVLGYTKNLDFCDISGSKVESEALDKVDEKGAYRIGRELNKWGAGSRREDSPSMFFPIPGPNGEEVYPIRNDGSEGRWRWGKVRLLQAVADGDVVYEKRENGTFIVYEKIRSTDPRRKAYASLLDEVGTNAEGTEDLKKLFEATCVMDFPKPCSLIRKLLEISVTSEDDIVLDFFAGSGTTAQSVLEFNKEDNVDRKFICVQLPEPTPEDSTANKTGYKYISDVCKERIRRVIEKIKKEKLDFDENKQDLGFKVFKLDRSNFKLWESKMLQDIENITEQLELHIDHIDPESSPEDILYELLLKSGFPLTAKAEKIHAACKTIYSVEEGSLIICLEDEITKELLKKIAEINPAQVICLDQGFREDDQLKTNAAQLFKTKEIEFKTV